MTIYKTIYNFIEELIVSFSETTNDKDLIRKKLYQEIISNGILFERNNNLSNEENLNIFKKSLQNYAFNCLAKA